MSRLRSALALLALACNAAESGAAFVEPLGAQTSGATETTAAPTGPRQDLGSTDGADEGDPCHRVDLLFVVDNSESMSDEQLALVTSFPGFIAGIESILGAKTDYHVGVITTDENPFNGVGCRRLGALTTQTGGAGSSAAKCGPYAEGFRFMTPADPLGPTFACAARVGVEGAGHERPMAAIATVLADDVRDLGTCNTDFIREGALLVLTIITDEDDGASPGDPSAWYDAVVAAKGGDAAGIVVLSLVGQPKPNACFAGQWDGMRGAEIATRIAAFTAMFEYGSVGDICSADYGPFFEDAMTRIAEACDVVPVG